MCICINFIYICNFWNLSSSPNFLSTYSCSESLYEDEEFDQRQLAALVASKVTSLFSNQFLLISRGRQFIMARSNFNIGSPLKLFVSFLRFSIIWVNITSHYPMHLELVLFLTFLRILTMFIQFLVLISYVIILFWWIWLLLMKLHLSTLLPLNFHIFATALSNDSCRFLLPVCIFWILSV